MSLITNHISLEWDAETLVSITCRDDMGPFTLWSQNLFDPEKKSIELMLKSSTLKWIQEYARKVWNARGQVECKEALKCSLKDWQRYKIKMPRPKSVLHCVKNDPNVVFYCTKDAPEVRNHKGKPCTKEDLQDKYSLDLHMIVFKLKGFRILVAEGEVPELLVRPQIALTHVYQHESLKDAFALLDFET